MPVPPSLSTRVVEPAVTAELRRSVLRPTFSADQPLPGDGDSGVVHVAAFLAGTAEPVGACLVFPEPCTFAGDPPAAAGAWRLRSMATAPAVRGLGAGAAVLAAAVDVVRGHGAVLLWCHARAGAEGFYRRHGWIGVGELFTEIGIDHRNMYLDIAAQPGAAPLR